MNMRRFFLVLLLSQAGLLQAATNLRDGLWEITTTPEGSPGTPQTIRQCLNRTEIDNLTRTLPGGGSACRPTTQDSGGSGAAWTLDCPGPPRITGGGEFTYAETTFSGVTRLSMDLAGDRLNLVQRVNGRRVGDCPGGK